ncbi:MAG: 2-amino-4-hydroxy-6-hydroxymethyldihydropteridine diphosphokinase [Thiobacillaceae bacterium]|nr:2-amino-4-hydroxy-6-hydroxymethyldihydropteridine diphosphokinase [Thiobacillaceae bacterium]MCX7672858.1 2-amino-4-hydroxy-6-hydroxymethyldihydropteridine diphosphokinase [Thiobacillaceae bacterium]MDW8324766.1 2-amino-4-hydroxy-6-hydroxymethyldihydropteridine diphosphokinase [Burkholderiales bacterium]
MHAPVDAYVALGANLGDPVRQILQALDELAGLPLTRLTARSPLYRSRPVGGPAQPDYVNAVARLATRLTPRALLAHCLAIEARHGRQRLQKNAPRTLDLDLLLFDGLVMDEPGLTLPHPRMHTRGFVLLPLARIAPQAIVPGHGRVIDLLATVDTGDLLQLPELDRRAVVPG